MSRRVVVTGMAGISSLGAGWTPTRAALEAGRSGVAHRPEWAEIDGLQSHVGAPVTEFTAPRSWPRKKTRTMGKDSLMATWVTEAALADAGLVGDPTLSDGGTGIAYGCTQGSPRGFEVYARNFYGARSLKGIRGSDFIRFMSHTCAANVAQFFELGGRIVPTCSACTSGSQGIGAGYESIRFGRQDRMLTGGAEELDAIDAAIFDVLLAASTRNDEPHRAARPFDADRDGTVVGEGAATLVLEEREAARARGARIHAEVLGYATNSDGRHMTNPDPGAMERVMRLALEDAGIGPADVDYVNAHASATEVGDVAESQATHAVFGEGIPVSSLKGHLGHALGACGALEAWMTVAMLTEGWVAPTLNLERVDERCAPLDYVRDGIRKLDRARIAVSNNFAFGGVNTSLVFRIGDGD